MILLGKSVEWLALVGALSLYLVLRTPSLPWMQRLGSSLMAAGMAFALSERISASLGVDELYVTIAIMVVGPFAVGTVLVLTEDKEFAKNTVQAWLLKRLGLEGEDRDT